MALNVTYGAWAIFFTVVILRDTSVLTPMTIFCALVVIVCSILSAADFERAVRCRAKPEFQLFRPERHYFGVQGNFLSNFKGFSVVILF